MKNQPWRIFPRHKLGRWSIGMIVLMPILFFIGSSLTNSLYKAFPSGETILADIIARPALALTMLAGIVAGVIAFILGFIDIFRKKENALLVYVSTLIGLLLIIFLVGEVIPPYH